MRIRLLTLLWLTAVLAGCGGDEPNGNGNNAVQVKVEADRMVLIGTDDGKLVDMKDGSVYATLPACTEVTGMTMHGETYYATGASSSGTLTYWTDGQAVSINGNGTTHGIARSYDNIYVLATGSGYTTVYRNGTELTRLNDAGDAVAIAAYGNNYYALTNSADGPMVWTGNGATTLTHSDSYRAVATGIDLVANSQGTTHYVSGHIDRVVDGVDVATPCLWTKGTLATLPVNFTDKEQNNHTYNEGQACDVAHKGTDVYTVGFRRDATGRKATVWVSSADDDDEVKTYWQNDGNVDATACRVLTYGVDVYVMTVEQNRDTHKWCTRIWMNHELKGTVNGIKGSSFVVI